MTIPVDTMPLTELIQQLTEEEKQGVIRYLQPAFKVWGAAGKSGLPKNEREKILRKFTRMVAGHLLLKSQAAKAA
ncbi:MAG: hypothetical protein Q8M83_03980 [bacterium]|nr:hypothetical protein [bacterium]